MVCRAWRARPGSAHRKPQPGGRISRADRAGVAFMSDAVPASGGGLAGESGGPVTREWPAPAPGAAPPARIVSAQAGPELRTLVRNGEQLLLTLIIPVLLLDRKSTRLNS